jgi:hypothetical protein
VEGSSGNSSLYFEDTTNTSNTSISYCDVYNNDGANFGGSVPAGLGDLVGVNGCGDSCDVYMNIFMDPMFVDTANGDFHLLAGSPCIDAGDPNSPLDPDGTIADIGAFYFDQVGIDGGSSANPEFAGLIANYPNPFNSSTTIEYDLPKSCDVTIEIYDVLGRRAATLIRDIQQAGHHSVVWDAGGYTSGMYFYRIQAGDFTETKKMLLLK